MTSPTGPTPALAAALVMAIAAAACATSAAPRTAGAAPAAQGPTTNSEAGQAPVTTAAPATTSPQTTEPSPRPSVSLRSAAANQDPPKSTLGLSFHENLLWVADFYSGHVLAVDPDSGSIVRRLTSEDNVSGEVIDVVAAPDEAEGILYWIGLNDGALAVLQGIASRSIGRVPPGTRAVSLSADRKTVYVGGAVGHPAPMWRIDTANERERRTALDLEGKPVPIHLRSFTVATDGTIYGVRFGPATGAPEGRGGALVTVDADTGLTTDLATGIDSPIAVKLSPDGTTAYVLSLPPGSPPALAAVSLATGAITALPRPKTPLADSLAVAPDNRIFVSSYNEPEVSVISPDGTVKILPIGRKPIK